MRVEMMQDGHKPVSPLRVIVTQLPFGRLYTMQMSICLCIQMMVWSKEGAYGTDAYRPITKVARHIRHTHTSHN
jgi:hypothetical protein